MLNRRRPFLGTMCASMALAAVVRADFYEAARVTQGRFDIRTIHTYRKDGSVRLAYIGQGKYNDRFYLWNNQRKRAYELDSTKRQYQEAELPDLLFSMARFIAHSPVRHSGKRVDVYYETIHIGERRQILGLTAKHLRFRERWVAAMGACKESSVTENDGWYVTSLNKQFDIPALLEKAGLLAMVEEAGCQNSKVVKHGEPATPGLLVFRERPNYRLELIALSFAPLDPSLFEIPAGYKKTNLSWTESIPSELNMLTESITDWFWKRWEATVGTL